jgi:hypothetical protein
MKPLKEDIKGCGRSLRPRVLQNIGLQRAEPDKLAGFRKCQSRCALCMDIEDSSTVIKEVPEVF